MSYAVKSLRESECMISKTISRYRILSRLGGGGLGVVCVAEDLKLRPHVALKSRQSRVTL
jgi:hypothetical protein